MTERQTTVTKDAAYWARIDRLIDRCPPIEPEYAAQLRSIFSPVREATR